MRWVFEGSAAAAAFAAGASGVNAATAVNAAVHANVVTADTTTRNRTPGRNRTQPAGRTTNSSLVANAVPPELLRQMLTNDEGPGSRAARAFVTVVRIAAFLHGSHF